MQQHTPAVGLVHALTLSYRFFPHNGIVDTAQSKPTVPDTNSFIETIANWVPTATQGLAEAYGMSPDLAIFLAIISIALAGDPVAGTWSIGGEYEPTVPLLTGPATGIAGTHNQYESDASIVSSPTLPRL